MMEFGKRLAVVMVLGGLSLVANVAAAQEQLSKTTATTLKYGDWIVRCNQQDQAKEECGMTQKVLAPNSRQQLLEANFAKTSNGTQMTLILPLGVYLPNGVSVEVVDWKKIELPIEFCSQSGCFVNRILPNDFVDLLRKKESAQVILWTAPDKKATIPLSIVGFLDAYKKLDS